MVTLSVTMAVALGIAASTAIFSVMEGVFSAAAAVPRSRSAGMVQHDDRELRPRPRGELSRRAGLEAASTRFEGSRY
jgi:hypothetical protein